VKITPVNFASYFEPELIKFWEGLHPDTSGKLRVQRNHNFKLLQTSVSLIDLAGDSETTELMVELVEIPQQEDFPALSCSIHMKDVQKVSQLLMVFKQDGDTSKWSQRIFDEVQEKLEKSDPEV